MFTMPFLAFDIAKNQGHLVLFPNGSGLLYRLNRVPVEAQLDPDQYLKDHPNIKPVVQLFINPKGLLMPIPLDGSNQYHKAIARFENMKESKIIQLFNQGFFSLELAIAAISSTLSDNGKKPIPEQLHAYHTLVGHQNATREQVRELLGIDRKAFDAIPDNVIEQPAIDAIASEVITLPVPKESKGKNTRNNRSSQSSKSAA